MGILSPKVQVLDNEHKEKIFGEAKRKEKES